MRNTCSSTVVSTRVRSNERVTLFWEVYGLAGRAEDVTVTLGVTHARGGWARRGAEARRLRKRPAPVRLRGTARSDDPRAVGTGAITLGAKELGRGRHDIALTVRTAAGDSASAVRTIVVER